MYQHILYIVSFRCHFNTKMQIRWCNKYLYERVEIYDIPYDLRDSLTNDILKSFTYLKKLEVYFCHDAYPNITDNGIKDLIFLEHLYTNNIMTDKGLEKLTQLKFINIYGHDNITNEGIAKLHNLRELYLGCNSTITIDGIKDLSRFNRIHKHNTKITGDELIQCNFNRTYNEDGLYIKNI